MEEVIFWHIIGEFSLGKTESMYLNEVIDKLKLMPESDIFQFEILLHRKIKSLCNWNCYGVFVLLEMIPDDEYFHDFRLWIISKGLSFYTQFSINPELVADEILATSHREMPYLQGLSFVSEDSLKKKNINSTIENGKDFQNFRERAFEVVGGYGSSDDLIGDKLSSDDDFKAKFPKIFDATKGEFLRYKESHDS
jgi:hypothetical protein